VLDHIRSVFAPRRHRCQIGRAAAVAAAVANSDGSTFLVGCRHGTALVVNWSSTETIILEFDRV